jgi:Na+-translocating ferredoxin:NAD+ oxidoreductase RnfG subunit
MRQWVTERVIVVWLSLTLWVVRETLTARRVWAQSPPALTEHSYEILEEYLSVEEALALLFPDADRLAQEEIRLTEAQAARVAELAEHPLWEEAFSVHRAYAGGQLQGYAVVAEEVGKFHLITFIVGVSPEGRVKRVEVLVYRESRGAEVRYRRFLHQYDGKSLGDPIRLNRDILNITGATLSVRAMNRGVRKVLGLLREIYGVR